MNRLEVTNRLNDLIDYMEKQKSQFADDEFFDIVECDKDIKALTLALLSLDTISQLANVCEDEKNFFRREVKSIISEFDYKCEWIYQ